MKTEDGAPFHLGSLSGNICPISGSPKAPKIASTTQCSNTSPAPPPKTTITIEINTKENHHLHQHTSIPRKSKKIKKTQNLESQNFLMKLSKFRT
jgi:hypothetical protein